MCLEGLQNIFSCCCFYFHKAHICYSFVFIMPVDGIDHVKLISGVFENWKFLEEKKHLV